MLSKFFTPQFREIFATLPVVILIFGLFILLLALPVMNKQNYSFAAAQQTEQNSIFSNVISANAFQQFSLESSEYLDEFELIIPKIGLRKEIVKNVHPVREEVYGPVIEKSIAHGQFTKLPDEAIDSGNVYLFAHREGSGNGVDFGFFRRLDELGQGDQVLINYQGKQYVYEFDFNFIVDPEDTWVYTGESSTPTLTLQTCENGIANRLIVKLNLVEIR